MVLAIAEIGDAYFVTVWPPDKAGVGVFDLHVNLGPTLTAIETQSVSYEELRVDEILVIDRSGSMDSVTSAEGRTKLESAKSAAKMLVDRANAAGKLGAVEFSDNAALVESLGDALPNQRTAIKDAIDLITAAGFTSIGDGLDLASDQFAALGHSDQADWVLLLSDGQENMPLFWADVEAQIKAAGIHVAAFALGEDADFRLMEEIATKTLGVFVPLDDDPMPSDGAAKPASAVKPDGAFQPNGAVFAKAPGSVPTAQSNALADAYLIANEVAEGNERLWDVGGDLAAGVPALEQFVVDEGGIRDATFAFHWSNPAVSVAVVVTRPDATVLSNALAGVEVYSGSSHVVFHLDALAPGTWNVSLVATGGSAEYIGVLSGRDLQAATLRVHLGSYHDDATAQSQGIRNLWGLPLPILAVLSDKNGSIAGATIRALIRHPDGTTLDLPLYDDGRVGDGGPGDGVYGNLYTRTTSTGLTPNYGPESAYAVSVVATGTNSADLPFTRIRKTAFVVGEVGDPIPDSDFDGMPDRYEALHLCLDPFLIGDAIEDADLDGLNSFDEWEIGTNPCDPDSDHGGETDGSEWARGANSFDRGDDALPQPVDPEVIDWVLEHIPFPAGVSLQPGANLIRYPDHPAYHRIRLWRTSNPAGGFAIVADFESSLFNGLYPDSGLVNGTTYHYMVQPVDLIGRVGAPSLIFSGTPKTDPIPPIGGVLIQNGQAQVDVVAVTLSLTASSDVVDMMITDSPSYDAAAWQPFAPTLAWNLQPDASGKALVHARFRDAAGNESPSVYNDDIEIAPAGSIGSISGVVLAAGLGDMSGVMIRIEDRIDLPPAFSAADGSWTFAGLEPGSYSLVLTFGGYEPATISAVQVVAGVDAPVGNIVLSATPGVPVQDWALVLLAVMLLALGIHRLRRASPEYFAYPPELR